MMPMRAPVEGECGWWGGDGTVWAGGGDEVEEGVVVVVVGEEVGEEVDEEVEDVEAGILLAVEPVVMRFA